MGEGDDLGAPIERHGSLAAMLQNCSGGKDEPTRQRSESEDSRCSSPRIRQPICYNAEINFFELELGSTSFPGLPCILRTRHLSLDQRAPVERASRVDTP